VPKLLIEDKIENKNEIKVEFKKKKKNMYVLHKFYILNFNNFK